jgi:hypothetical protein
MIHDLDAPKIAVEPRRPDEVTVRNRLVIMLCISAATLTVVNLVAAVKLYTSAERMSELGARLDQLAAFEKRITDKIDLVNVGLQNQFDNLDASVASRFSETSSGIGALERQLVRSSNGYAPGTGDVTEQESPRIATEMEHLPADGTVTGLSPAYQRIETPEGKVTYRKIR